MGEEVSELQERGDNEGKDAGSCCPVMGTVLGLVGAVGGGVLGYFLFMAIAERGFLALVLPGALVGIGCGALSGRKSNGLGILCGILGLAAGIFSEWRRAPLAEDDSLYFFVTHFHENGSVIMVLTAVGGIFAFYFGRGRKGGAWLRKGKRVDRD